MSSTSVKASTVDLSGERNHLGRLPPELLHLIIGYLFCEHDPSKAFRDRWFQAPKKQETGHAHPLDYFAASSRQCRVETSNWAHHFLLGHKDITRYQPSMTSIRPQNKNSSLLPSLLRGRRGLLSWSSRCCVYCGRASKRAAIFMSSMHCCAACDKVQWPDKITKTDAMQQYGLKIQHLLPHQDPAAPRPEGLPVPHYGTCVSLGVLTTMFLKRDVEQLAELVHGDLEAWMKKKEVRKAERRRRADERASRTSQPERVCQVAIPATAREQCILEESR